jgi:hypothetical protein
MPGGRQGQYDGEETTIVKQQAARTTYPEHVSCRHRAHVPITDGLIEGSGNLQCSEGRAVVWHEQRSGSKGTGDDDDMATQEQQYAGWRTSTQNMPYMSVTELTSQSPMG